MYLLMQLDVNSVIGQKNLKIFVRNVSFNLLNLSLVNLFQSHTKITAAGKISF